jgi:hypothetical protein
MMHARVLYSRAYDELLGSADYNERKPSDHEEARRCSGSASAPALAASAPGLSTSDRPSPVND